jgi:hypothetical protein
MQQDLQEKRIESIVGDPEDIDFDEAREIYYQYLKENLDLPCEVTGIEDFEWEEFYVLGPGNRKEYEHLKKDQPSYTDRYELLSIGTELESQWFMYWEDDLAGQVKRLSDGKEFVLGLSELKAVDKKSKQYQLLDDFSFWVVNYR